MNVKTIQSGRHITENELATEIIQVCGLTTEWLLNEIAKEEQNKIKK